MLAEPSARFFRLAERTFAFEGVMHARYMAERERHAASSVQGRGGAMFQHENLKRGGGEVRVVKTSQPSYLEEKLNFKKDE